MAKINIKTSKKIEPKCYAYTTPEIARHNGWTKIGYTEQDDVTKRILQQTQTADIKFSCNNITFCINCTGNVE